MAEVTVGTLGPYDVVCGRVKLAYNHQGNKFFRKVVDDHAKAYKTAPTRAAKSNICSQIIGLIHSNGGRFLSFVKKCGPYTNSSPMVEVYFSYAYEKVSHALRSLHKDPIKKWQRIVTNQRKAALQLTEEDEKVTSNEKNWNGSPDATMKLIQEYEKEIDNIKNTMKKNKAELMSKENANFDATSLVYDRSLYTGFIDSEGNNTSSIQNCSPSSLNSYILYTNTGQNYLSTQPDYALSNVVSGVPLNTFFMDSERATLNQTSSLPLSLDSSMLYMNSALPGISSYHVYDPLAHNTVSPYESPAKMKPLFQQNTFKQHQINPEITDYNKVIHDGDEDHIVSSCDDDDISALDPELCHEYYNTEIIEVDGYPHK